MGRPGQEGHVAVSVQVKDPAGPGVAEWRPITYMRMMTLNLGVERPEEQQAGSRSGRGTATAAGVFGLGQS